MYTPKSLRNEDNSLVSEQKPYWLCMDSTDVPNPHNISPNQAMKHLADPPDNPNGICVGYDALACNNIYYRECDSSGPFDPCKGYLNDKGEEIVYPCAWNSTTQKCGVDPKNNPRLGKDTAYLINSMTIGENDKGKTNWDTSCYRLMGDPNCLYNNTDCADTATPDVHDALKCWVGKDGIPYASNSILMPSSERNERTVPTAYTDCSVFGSNCVPEDCGCGGWYNEARWGGGSKNCGDDLSCDQNSICKK
jgi:hypothetical protein